MSTITRGTKAGTGTTDFGSGTTILASEVNADLNTIVNEINGGLTNANISGSADIALSKLGDYSSSATQQDNTADPGTAGSESLATTLQGEIERLRYAVARLAGYINAERQNASGAQSVAWIEPPVLGENLLRNASFGTASSATADLPDGFATVGTSTYGRADASAAEGFGQTLTVVASGAGDGISYTLSELKASTKYLIVVRGALSLGDATIATTGADAATEYRNVNHDMSGASQAQYVFVVKTDSTPTDIVLKVTSPTSGYTAVFRHFGVYEMGTEPGIPALQQSFAVGTDASASLTAGAGASDVCTVDVYVPPGHYVKIAVDGQVRSTNAAALFTYQINDDDDLALGSVLTIDLTNTNQDFPLAIVRIDNAPTYGATNSYKLNCSATTNNCATTNITMNAEVIPLR